MFGIDGNSGIKLLNDDINHLLDCDRLERILLASAP